MQVREKENREIALEARIFVEKEKLHILTLLNTFVLFLLLMKMKLTRIFFLLKK